MGTKSGQPPPPWEPNQGTGTAPRHEFEFVKDRRRNRLSHEKANKLVSLFHNLRLLKRMKKPQYSEPMIAWGDSEELDVACSRVTKYSAAGSSSGGPSKLLAAQKKEPVKKDPLPLLPSV